MQTLARGARHLVYPFALLFLLMGFVSQTAVAGIVGTDTVISESASADKRAEVMALLHRDDVRQKLVDYGVSPQEAQERVASMTESELAELARNIDDMPAGAGGIVLVLVLVILIILLVR